MAKKKVSPARKRRKSAKIRAVEKTHVKALDAIPATGVRFGKAYELVLERYKQKPKAGTYHEYWRKEVDREKTLGGDEIDLEAEYLFRQLLDVGELYGCVLHPCSGETLHLAPDIWLSEPSEFDGDYLVPHDASRGNGTEINASLRPVFFKTEELNRWLNETFEVSGGPENFQVRKKTATHQLSAMRAIRTIWPNKEWEFLALKVIYKRVEEYLEESGLPSVSEQSVKRALQKMKRRSSDNTSTDRT